MAKVVITGAEEIRRNLQAAQIEIKKNVLKGMINGARIVQRGVTINDLPTTPVDIGNLRASFFISTILGVKAGASPKFRVMNPKNKHKLTPAKFAELQAGHASALNTNVMVARNLTVILGYGANYAIWVHEMEGDINWSKDGSGPKWFEKSLKKNKAAILLAIGTAAKISSTKTYTTTRTKQGHTDITNVDDIDTSVFLGKSD
jgi:hypothetical protein